MATSTFTTWRALADKLKDELQLAANNSEFRVKSMTQPDGVTVTYSTFQDMYRAWALADSMAKAEEDSSSRPRHAPIFLRGANDR